MEKSFLQRIKSRLSTMRRRMGLSVRQESSRELFTFLGFVVLALLFWFMQGMNEEVESSFKIPVELQNLPDKVVLIDDLPATVEVRIRDKGPAMLGYWLKGLEPLSIDFQEYDRGGNSFMLLPTQLKTILRKDIRPSTAIVSMLPDTLKVIYTHNAGKQVKLVVKGSVTTTPQCVQSGPMTADVDSVMVYGELALLKSLNEVYTVEIDEKRLSDTLQTVVGIARIPRVRIVPQQVTVTIPVEEMVSKTLDIPICPQQVPVGWSLITFPPSVKLSCMMPFSQFATVNEEGFLLGVDCTELSQHSQKLGIKVLKSPENIRNIILSQDSVDYILEEVRTLPLDTTVVETIPDTILWSE